MNCVQKYLVIVHVEMKLDVLTILPTLASSVEMRILQINSQSVNTSRYFLNQAVHQHQPDVVALQEVWTLPEDFKIIGCVLAAEKLTPTKKNEE